MHRHVNFSLPSVPEYMLIHKVMDLYFCCTDFHTTICETLHGVTHLCFRYTYMVEGAISFKDTGQPTADWYKHGLLKSGDAKTTGIRALMEGSKCNCFYVRFVYK